MGHAELAPSAAHRWLNCTSSARLEALFGRESSAFAEEGTAAHLQAANILTGVEPLTEDTDIFVRRYIEYIHEQMLPGASRYIEYAVDMAPTVRGCHGTCDCVLVNDECLTVIDLKYGAGVVVSAADNPQLLLYALGAHLKFTDYYDYDKIRVCIFQPRADNISSRMLTVKELLTWAKEIKPAAKLAYEGKGGQVPGKWCQFCRAKGLCEGRAGKNLEALAKYDILQAAPLQDMDKIVKILQAREQIKTWLEDVYKYALSKALSGGTIPGFKLVEGGSKSKVDPNKETDLINNLTTAGYSLKQVSKLNLTTLTELKALLGKQKYKELVEGYVIKPTGKIVLVPENNGKIEIQSSAEIDFREFKEG